MTRVGRYQLLAEVARGGMGVVHRARGAEGQAVALKLLLAGKDANPLQRRRVATEIQSLLRLRHANVVALLDAGEHEGVPFVVTEWIEGESLGARLARDGPLDWRDAVELVRRLAEALEHCHARGVLHRDLKPDNVLLRASDGAPLLVDFGISKDVASASQSTVLNTLAGRWLGTPGWWPPEQALGEMDAVGPRSDVYGLGALLHGALTGDPPQPGETLNELLAGLDRPPVPPGARRKGIPAWLDAVCVRALAPDPAARHASATELARELGQGAARGERSRKERRWGARVAVALLGLLALGAALAPLAALPGRGPPIEAARQAWREGAEERALELAGAALAGKDRAAAQLVRAQVLHASGATAPALEAARAATQFATDPAERAFAAGLVAALAGDQDALSSLDEASARRPEDPDVAFCRGRARQALNDLRGALEDYDRALARAPRYFRALDQRGLLRIALRDFPGAIEDFSRALELRPGHTAARVNLGSARQALGDLTGAFAEYSRAIEGDPSCATAYANRGSVRHAQGDLANALVDHDRAITLAPTFANARYSRGLARLDRGDHLGAIEDFTAAVALAPGDTDSLVCRGRALRARGDLAGGLADFERALAQDARHAGAWQERAAVREEQGDLAGALEDFGRALEIEARGAVALRGRARMRRAMGDLQGAIEDCTRVLEVEPRHAVTFYNRGNARAAQGDHQGAIEDYGRAIEVDPGYSEAHNNRGASRHALHDLAGAVEDTTRAIALDPKNARAHLNRGHARSGQGDLQGALADYERATALDPGYAKAHVYVGLTRQSLGDLPGAVSALQRAVALFPPGSADAGHVRDLLEAARRRNPDGR